ncbi:MAG: hypothetical protein JWO45_1203, partial [Spartobacteria bacterium]|nr:hypothetical protein [Spartobacteria bacterium]
MFHFNGQVWFNACDRRQNVIQDLFCRHPELAATRANLQPPGLVAKIALREILCGNQDHIAVIGKFSDRLHKPNESKTQPPLFMASLRPVTAGLRLSFLLSNFAILLFIHRLHPVSP